PRRVQRLHRRHDHRDIQCFSYVDTEAGIDVDDDAVGTLRHDPGIARRPLHQLLPLPQQLREVVQFHLADRGVEARFLQPVLDIGAQIVELDPVRGYQALEVGIGPQHDVMALLFELYGKGQIGPDITSRADCGDSDAFAHAPVRRNYSAAAANPLDV